MFVNEHHDTEIGKTVDGTDSNISIIGRGEAILDGGKYNGLSEKTQLINGLPPIWKNNLLLFTNVDGFKVEGISCRNQRWWALNFIYCSNGYLGNIDFCACDIGVDENGQEYHGLKRSKYGQVLVKNADGIDLRQGCHDIVIENITGFTEDDTVALTGLNGRLEQAFSVDGLPSDICNVEIKNVRS
jgi:polygalacturonase